VSTPGLDPYGNGQPDGGIRFFTPDSRNALAAGAVADLTLATLSSFVGQGFDLFLHYSGNPTNDWDIQVYGQDVPSLGGQIAAVPEPSTLVLAGVACAVLFGCRLTRRWMRHSIN
jgi:hypothetical protein